MSATSTKLVSLHCQFHKNILRKMINCYNWSNIFRRFCYSPYDALEFMCIAMHERPIISIARRTLADTFSTLFGCVQFSVLSHDKRIGLTKFNYFESISSRCRLSNVSGDNCVGVALSPPRSPQKWKNVRGEAKLGCGGATAPHAYFKPCIQNIFNACVLSQKWKIRTKNALMS